MLRDIEGKGMLLYFVNWHELNTKVLSVLPGTTGRGAVWCRTSALGVSMPRASPPAKELNLRDLHQAKLYHAAVVHESWPPLLIVE